VEEEEEPVFESIRGAAATAAAHHHHRNRSKSVPGDSTTRNRGSSSRYNNRHHHQSTPSEEQATSQSINAYTYRVRTNTTHSFLQSIFGKSNNTNKTNNGYDNEDTTAATTTLDEHHLRLSKASDGTTYLLTSSIITMQTDEHKETTNGFGNDDVPESDTGLLMASSSSSDIHHKGGGGSAVVPLNAISALETSLAEKDNGILPPHVHPSVPSEMLRSKYTSTAPPLKLWPLAVLVFYNVSGGPFGIEPSIRAGGNFYAILGFVVFPLIWSVPEALVTAELGSAFQDPSAGVAWVEEAFGETMGSLCGYLAWVSGATDNAIYPTLFIEYVSSVAGWDEEDFGGWSRYGSIALLTIILAMLNYTGLEIVGNASLVVCIIAMSPFIVMMIMGAHQIDVSRWFQMPEAPEDGAELFDDDFQTSPGPLPLLSLGGILWRPYLNNLFWNLNSFDSAGSFSGETDCVNRTYPRGIFIGLVMCVLGYLMPLLVAVGATDYKQEDWVDGHLGAVAVDIGGKWLGGWMIFAAGISNLALFEAEMSSDAFQLMGMAERGYLPKILTTRSKYGTPTAGIIFNTIVVVAFASADFGQLLELLNSVYALSLLMEYGAFVKLRLHRKELKRPYRVPIPDWAAIIFVTPPALGILVIFITSNWYVYIFCTGAIVFGVLLFKLSEIAKERGWCDFVSRETTSQNHHEYVISDVEENDTITAEQTECLVHDHDSPTKLVPSANNNGTAQLEFISDGNSEVLVQDENRIT